MATYIHDNTQGQTTGQADRPQTSWTNAPPENNRYLLSLRGCLSSCLVSGRGLSCLSAPHGKPTTAWTRMSPCGIMAWSPPPTEAWYLFNSSRLVQFRSRYEPHIFLKRNLSCPRHSHTPHFRAGRGQLHPMSGVSYCIARYRHPDAAQVARMQLSSWHGRG